MLVRYSIAVPVAQTVALLVLAVVRRTVSLLQIRPGALATLARWRRTHLTPVWLGLVRLPQLDGHNWACRSGS
jgi:hypothetical protein